MIMIETSKFAVGSMLMTAAVLCAASANAAIVVVDTTRFDVGFAVSSTDLLQTNLASTVAVGDFSHEGSAGVRALTDGGFGSQGNQGNGGRAATADENNTLTYYFNGAFDLISIATYSGWDYWRGGQSYTVSYATAAAPAAFIVLASEYNNAAGGSHDVNTRAVIYDNLVDYLATNVIAVKFSFNGDLTYGYAGYREIDIFGDREFAAVPEPAAWAMMVVGFGFVGGVVRRRKLVVA